MRISLTVTAGPHEGQVFSFEGHDTFIVGRSKRSHFRLPHKDKYFSRVHFMVEVNPPFCRLMDMGSTNGTYVNGQRLQKPIDLKHGDEIRAGKTVLLVRVEDEAGVAVTAPAAAATQAAIPEVAVCHPAALASEPPFPRLLSDVPAPVAAPAVPDGELAAEAAPPAEPAPWPLPPWRPSAPTPAPPTRIPTPLPSEPVLAQQVLPEQPPAVPPPPAPRPSSVTQIPPTREPEPVDILRDMPTPAAPPMPAARVVPAARETCVVCLNQYIVPSPPGGVASAKAPPPICPSCADQLRQQHQPIAGYQILRKLGHGGMGVVYLALRTVDQSLVALKTIIPSGASNQTKVERFLREADILHELDHPNIVKFREMGESNGTLYFAMDYVPGTDAAHLLKQNGGPMAIGRAVELACQLLDALDFAHGKGFVHRDIKPANLMVTQINGKEHLKLADFGLARVYQASDLSGLTMMGDMGGTLAFMAPEQITHFREAKPPADLYAAAATLYNLLTDRFVHDLPKAAEQRLLMILTDETVPIQRRRADIPEPLSAIIHRALAKDAELRFTDARTMRKVLLPFAR